MRTNRVVTLLVGMGLLLSSLTLVAHHSVSAEFDTTKKVTFTGAVKKVDWMNPHIYTHVEVKEPDGKITVYRVEGGAPNALFRSGIRPDSLKPGTIVTCTNCSRSKNPESMNVNGRLTLADGRPALAPTADNGN
jgi:Family of unknown function (DUF6152)